MKSLENVTVTIVFKPSGKSIDMELPAFMPMSELEGKLLETLSAINPAAFSNSDKLDIRHAGRVLAPNDTLASRGIWDGAVLEIYGGLLK